MSHTELLKTFTVPKKIETFKPVESGILVPVKCVNVYDGDTVKLAFHLFNDPANKIVVFPCRLIGIDTPEMKGPSKAEAIKARDFLSNLCLNKCLMAKFHTDVNEKYGRMLVELFVEDGSVNEKLIVGGYAKKYDGGKKE